MQVLVVSILIAVSPSFSIFFSYFFCAKEPALHFDDKIYMSKGGEVGRPGGGGATAFENYLKSTSAPRWDFQYSGLKTNCRNSADLATNSVI